MLNDFIMCVCIHRFVWMTAYCTQNEACCSDASCEEMPACISVTRWSTDLPKPSLPSHWRSCLRAAQHLPLSTLAALATPTASPPIRSCGTGTSCNWWITPTWARSIRSASRFGPASTAYREKALQTRPMKLQDMTRWTLIIKNGSTWRKSGRDEIAEHMTEDRPPDLLGVQGSNERQRERLRDKEKQKRNHWRWTQHLIVYRLFYFLLPPLTPFRYPTSPSHTTAPSTYS